MNEFGEDGRIVAQHGYELLDGIELEWTVAIQHEDLESGGWVETWALESGIPALWAVADARYVYNRKGVLESSHTVSGVGSTEDIDYGLTADGCAHTRATTTFVPSDPVVSWETGVPSIEEQRWTYEDKRPTLYEHEIPESDWLSPHSYEWTCFGG